MALHRGRVSEPKQALPAEVSSEYTFTPTLLESPALPISLVRQIRGVLRERRSERQQGLETPLPILDMKPWFRNLPEQVRSLLAGRKAAPVMFTSHPVAVPNIWQDFPQNPFSWANSLLIHLFALTAMLLPFAIPNMLRPPPIPTRLFDLTPLVLRLPPLHGHADRTAGGGGSGDRTPRLPSKGVLPPFARMQFTPAIAQIPKVAALLPMPVTLLGPPELKLPEMKPDMPWGDPKGIMGPLSGGPGTGGSFGTGEGTGIGPGKGPGYGPGSDGGCCEGVYSVGNGISQPIAIYSPEPAYSDEARKAKFEGVVVLWIVVDAQGNVQNVRLAKPLGMGLDEEAIKTVSTWKFKPALRNSTPVPVQVEVEVSFRLF